MSRQKNSRRRHRLAPWLLLALLCIGAAELAVCRFADPALFRRITAPVTGLFRSVRSAGTQLAEQAAGLLSSPAEEPYEEAPVQQLAGDPAIQQTPPAQDPAITELIDLHGREILTGGVVDIVYYNQGEEPWASQSLGPDPIAGYGCGPTALAMLISSLTQQDTDPAQMAQWAYEEGYCAPGSGSYLSIVAGTASAYGLEAVPCRDFSADTLCQELSSGHIFVALMGPGHFTSSGHFILLRGVTLRGEVLVADPNSRDRSLAAWDPQLILDELSASRSSGAPLWRFSTLEPVPLS